MGWLVSFDMGKNEPNEPVGTKETCGTNHECERVYKQERVEEEED